MLAPEQLILQLSANACNCDSLSRLSFADRTVAFLELYLLVVFLHEAPLGAKDPSNNGHVLDAFHGMVSTVAHLRFLRAYHFDCKFD